MFVLVLLWWSSRPYGYIRRNFHHLCWGTVDNVIFSGGVIEFDNQTSVYLTPHHNTTHFHVSIHNHDCYNPYFHSSITFRMFVPTLKKEIVKYLCTNVIHRKLGFCRFKWKRFCTHLTCVINIILEFVLRFKNSFIQEFKCSYLSY